MKLYSETIGSGPDLVLLHGWGMNAAVWSGIKLRLAERYRLTLVELPGHGESGFDPDCRSLQQWAEAILAAAPQQAVWVGWSLGGAIAQWVAVNRPQRISKLVVVTGTPRFVKSEDWPHGMAEATFHQFSANLSVNHTQTLGRFLSLQVQGDSEARQTLRQLRQEIASRPEPDPDALAVGLNLLLTVDLRPSLQQFNLPVLWLLGERDTLVPASLAEALKQQLPTATIHTIARCAHAPFLSHADETVAVLNRFLGEPNG